MSKLKRQLMRFFALPMIGAGVVLIIFSWSTAKENYQEAESVSITQEQMDELLKILDEKYSFGVIASWDPATLQMELQKEADKIFGKCPRVKIVVLENRTSGSIVERLSK